MKSMNRSSVRALMATALAVGVALIVVPIPSLSALASAANPSGPQDQTKTTKPPRPPLQHSTKVNKHVLNIKFRDQSDVRLEQGRFAGSDRDQVAELNRIIDREGGIKAEPLAQPQSGGSEEIVSRSLKDYFRVRFGRDLDVDSVIAELAQLTIVEEVYGQPRPAPLPTANYTTLQTYLNAAPTGVNRQFATGWPGGQGGYVKIVDLEYSWNVNHEDLSRARSSIVPNGTPYDPFPEEQANHGTAVLGEMLAGVNGYGVSGITPNSSLELINVANLERDWDLIGALTLASARTKPGDIILVEQQASGPTSETQGYVPVEWIPAVYDAIKALTSSGRIVVEAAGNGAQNLDDTRYYGQTFPSNRPDSGAIIVGAGENCNPSAVRSGLPGLPGSGTNYGRRVDLQGPGNCVTTTGYGDLSPAGAGRNAWYTARFGGTSSASPFVAAAAASISSAHLALNKSALTSQQVRDILKRTGTPQYFTKLFQGNIGPQPDLAKALPKTDKTPPSTPGGLTISLNGVRKPILRWARSTDNVRITGYQIFRNGSYFRFVTGTSFTDTSVAKGKIYKYKVRAVDAAGLLSPFSAPLSIKP